MRALPLPTARFCPSKLISPTRASKATALRCWAMTGSAPKTSCRVAVIGAGAAGLVSVRELLREGHHVVAFEQGPRPGGVWVYDEATDSDLLGAHNSRRRVHGSMYRDLRTNLPRELMGFSDVPFTSQMMGTASTDRRRFPSHSEVLAYLNMFAEMHQLHKHIQYNTQVLQATPISADSSSSSRARSSSTANGNSDGADSSSSSGNGSSANGRSAASSSKGSSSSSTRANSSSSMNGSSNGSSSSSQGPRWQLQTDELGADGSPGSRPQQQVFDVLLICNGHYSEPNLPNVPGADVWPGQQMHSHNYRVPEQFTGQTVVVVGASNSGEDVCKQVSAVADQVIVAARSWKNPDWAKDPRPFGPRHNVSRRGMISQLHPDGRVAFSEGPALQHADTIIYCTGYRYKFPFLEHNPATSAFSGQQCVPGLYQHMFAPEFGPSLAFVGLPWKIVPFPQFELQAKYIARLLSGRANLPPAAEMQSGIDAYYKRLQHDGIDLRYAHMMGDDQWRYNDWLAQAAGPDVKGLPSWRLAMYASAGANKRAYPDGYRDRWDDADNAAEAEKELNSMAQRLQAVNA